MAFVACCITAPEYFRSHPSRIIGFAKKRPPIDDYHNNNIRRETMVMIPSLVPIRTDFLAGDKSLHVVGTLLFDLTVWLIPFSQHVLIGSNHNNNNNTMNTYDAARTAWVESNVQLLANEVLLRTRMELWRR
jgi:hypothetical protein